MQLVDLMPKREGLECYLLQLKRSGGGFHGIIQKLEICSLQLRGIIRRCLIYAREEETHSIWIIARFYDVWGKLWFQ